MATLVHCDGCGFTEPEDLADSKKTIQTVAVKIVRDKRFTESDDKHESDLCPDCQGRMLHEYFSIPAEGRLDTPAFVGPRKLDETPHPQSRKAHG
jgi:hypothetical protein